MEAFEYKGQWWLPENIGNPVFGTLKYYPIGGTTLELMGSFKEVKDTNTFLSPSIILGMTSDGKMITLYNCHEDKYNYSFPGILTSNFSVDTIFEGCHFNKEEEIVFDNLLINYSNLEAWVGISGFQLDIGYPSKEKPLKQAITYSSPEKHIFNLDALNVSIVYEFNMNVDRIREARMKQTTFLEIQTHIPTHFNDYQSGICYHLQNLLSLGMGIATYPLIIKGQNKEHKTILKDRDPIYKDIFIYYSFRSNLEHPKQISSFNMLFSFNQVADQFEQYLRNWIGKSEILRPVYDLYFDRVNLIV
jgi:hypothetical protein